jgi:hypothetical protein
MLRRLPSLALLGSIAFAGCRTAPHETGDADGRTALALPAHAAAAVRAEMRTMLESLHDIHRGLAAGDTALIHQAATRSGLAQAADPELEPLLPEGFLRLGVATHAEFDSLAAAIGAGTPPGDLLARLPRLSAGCVACHRTYRLAPNGR